MKLAKTIIACVICLTLAISTAAIGFSIDLNAKLDVTASASKVGVGETFTITVAISGECEDVASGKAPLTYDSSLVEYVSGQAMGVNTVATASEASASAVPAAFMYEGGIDSTYAQLYVCTFKAISDGTAVFGIADSKYGITKDDEEVNLIAGTASVEIGSDDVTLYAKASANEVNVGDEFTVTVGVSGEVAEIGSGSFPLTISNNAIISKVSGPATSSAVEAEFVSDSAINAGCYFSNGLGSNSTFYTVTFKAVSEGTVTFSFNDSACYFIDVNDAPVAFTTKGDTVVIKSESTVEDTTTDTTTEATTEPKTEESTKAESTTEKKLDDDSAVAYIKADSPKTVGDTFTITVALKSGCDNIATGKLPVFYDESLVEFVGSASVNGSNAISAPAEVANSRINDTFVFEGSANSTDFDVYTLTFKALNVGTANFTFDKSTAYVIDSNDTELKLSYVDGAVEIVAENPDETTVVNPDETTTIVNPNETTTKAPIDVKSAVAYIKADSPKTVGDTFTITVALKSGCDNIASGKLPVFYDESLVEYVSAAGVTGSNAISAPAEVSNSRINDTFSIQNAASSNDFDVYTLTFKALKVGVANFTFDKTTAYVIDADDSELALSYIDGSVEIVAGTPVETTTVVNPDETTTSKTIVNPDETTTAKADETTTVAPPTEAPSSEIGTKPVEDTPKTGADGSMAIIAGITVLAAAAYVFTKKSK